MPGKANETQGRAATAWPWGGLLLLATLGAVACGADNNTSDGGTNGGTNAAQVQQGQDIFRYDTFGDEQLWTDVLRMNEVIESRGQSRRRRWGSGLKVDADALPPGFLADGGPQLTRHHGGADQAATPWSASRGRCQRRHSRPAHAGGHHLRPVPLDRGRLGGPGHRQAPRRLAEPRPRTPGAIIALSPALTTDQKAVYNSWGPGRYDPRFNIDGINDAVADPAGLRAAHGVAHVQATYTGDGDITYWNNYVVGDADGRAGYLLRPADRSRSHAAARHAGPGSAQARRAASSTS